MEDTYESRVTNDYEEPIVQPAIWDMDTRDEDGEAPPEPEPSHSGIQAQSSVCIAPLQRRFDAALDDLATQLADGHTDAYRQLVAFYSRFHHFSLANSILIMLQKPDANAVAGYEKWKQRGRQVRKHTKAARIWCPLKFKALNCKNAKDSEDDDEIVQLGVRGFKACYVFADKDLIDADTNPIPVTRPLLADNYPELLQRLKTAVIASGVTLREVPHIRGAEGYYTRSSHQIVLVQDRDSHNQVLIILHEWAHALFHHEEEAANWPQALKEFQSETVAMVMGHILGVPSPYANDYLLSFGVTAAQLKASIGHIHGLVGQMTKQLNTPSTAL
ncbi:hypothetical protein BH23CHL5_BH23CHL5_24950 [soil metagenome]